MNGRNSVTSSTDNTSFLPVSRQRHRGDKRHQTLRRNTDNPVTITLQIL
jgi:hypothetical protein